MVDEERASLAIAVDEHHSDLQKLASGFAVGLKLSR
jgi:hypothetical protein